MVASRRSGGKHGSGGSDHRGTGIAATSRRRLVPRDVARARGGGSRGGDRHLFPFESRGAVALAPGGRGRGLPVRRSRCGWPRRMPGLLCCTSWGRMSWLARGHRPWCQQDGGRRQRPRWDGHWSVVAWHRAFGSRGLNWPRLGLPSTEFRTRGQCLARDGRGAQWCVARPEFASNSGTISVSEIVSGDCYGYNSALVLSLALG